MSVDPDVATTIQPYVFANDDPLNAEDALGLSWDGPDNMMIGPQNTNQLEGEAEEANYAAGGAETQGSEKAVMAAGESTNSADEVDNGDIRNFELRQDTSHIFRDAPGHLADETPENRQLTSETANNSENLVGDERGVSTYRQTLADGRQAWAEVYGGEITNGGVNDVPRK